MATSPVSLQTQEIWISETGEILRESGLMGLALEKTDKHDALAKIDVKAGDLAETLAIASNVIFNDPERLEMLKVKLQEVKSTKTKKGDK